MVCSDVQVEGPVWLAEAISLNKALGVCQTVQMNRVVALENRTLIGYVYFSSS